VIYANKRVGELADLSTRSLAGMQVDQILARIIAKASGRPASKNVLQKRLDKTGERTFEISQNASDRTSYWRLEVFNVNDEEGLPIGRGIFFHDVTADRELDRMRSSLVSTVSHELRTPLAAIKGYASTMLADDVEWDRAAQHEFLTIISDESDRLTDLVNNLLDLSRIEAGSLKLSREPCQVQAMVNEAAKRAHLSPGNTFELHVDDGLPLLYADPPRLESILRNLIENAIKYGGERAKIRVDVCRQGKDFLFRVIDDGPGIPAEERQRIFESFYRVDDSLARLTSGAGLGLAICQGLVRAHGGRIWAEPRETGACIAFTIPIRRTPSPKDHKERKAADRR
jgi:signal transduction histidine kinase